MPIQNVAPVSSRLVSAYLGATPSFPIQSPSISINNTLAASSDPLRIGGIQNLLSFPSGMIFDVRINPR